ncbi:MAG: hypothetical protein ABL997_08260 [Planctomycetota bacterium]
MNAMFPCVLSVSFLLVACSKESPHGGAPTGSHVHADGTVHQDEPAKAPHVHTDRQDLGEIVVGGHAIHVFQVAAMVPGKEGDFDLDFAAGATLPTAVRGWIGAESGQGSMKVRFGKETATRMHGHPEVPSPLPDGSALWIEVEGPSGVSVGSVAFRR